MTSCKEGDATAKGKRTKFTVEIDIMQKYGTIDKSDRRDMCKILRKLGWYSGEELAEIIERG